MTKMEMFAAIKVAVADNADMVEFIDKEMAALAKRNARKSTKPTKTQAENALIKETIKETLADAEAMTATEIAAAVGVSLAKATALLTQLVKAEEIHREVEKKVARFSL